MPLNSGLFVRMGVSNKSDVSITLGNWRLGELKKPLFYQEETFFLVVSHYFYCAKKYKLVWENAESPEKIYWKRNLSRKIS